MPDSGISTFWIFFFSTCVILNYTGKQLVSRDLQTQVHGGLCVYERTESQPQTLEGERERAGRVLLHTLEGEREHEGSSFTR